MGILREIRYIKTNLEWESVTKGSCLKSIDFLFCLSRCNFVVVVDCSNYEIGGEL